MLYHYKTNATARIMIRLMSECAKHEHMEDALSERMLNSCLASFSNPNSGHLLTPDKSGESISEMMARLRKQYLLHKGLPAHMQISVSRQDLIEFLDGMPST